MPRILSNPVATQFPHMPIGAFGLVNVGTNQAQVALKVNVNDATSGSLNITGIPAFFDGSIVGISAVLTNAKTAGVLGVSPTIAGTEIGSAIPLYRTPIANTKTFVVANADAQTPGLTFTQGQSIGVKLTTDGSFAAGATPDLYVVVLVAYQGVQL